MKVWFRVNIFCLILLILPSIIVIAQEEFDTVETGIDTSYFISGDDEYNLLAAADRGDSVIVHRLLKRDADVNTKSWENVTPLMYAAGNGHLGTVMILVQFGAMVNEKPDNEMSALLSAAQMEYLDIVEYLILNGADIDDQDNEGASSLMYAAAYNYFVLADMLLFYGADPEIKDKEGNTALLVAAHAGNTEIVDLLLVNQADAECRDNDGNTPLMVASGHGYADIVQTLIEFNVELNTMNSEGMTALAFASRNGHKAVVEKLLYYETDPDICTSRTNNPMFLAKKNSHFEIENMLRETGAKNMPKKIEINRMGMAFDMNWNSTDFLYAGSIDMQNDQWGIDIGAGYLTRAGYKRVLIEKGEHSYNQLYEKRSLVYLSCIKRIKLNSKSYSNANGIFIGCKGLYTYGHYRGVPFSPENRYLIAPGIGYYALGRYTSLKISYEYLNFDVYKVSPHRINISLGFLINFKKNTASDYKINWLD